MINLLGCLGLLAVSWSPMIISSILWGWQGFWISLFVVTAFGLSILLAAAKDQDE